MSKVLRYASVLWTGGKDSCLALYEARLLKYEIVSLVTFVSDEQVFLAHPISFMKYQADALCLPHYTLQVNEPFEESYKKAILSLQEKQKIGTLVTGDIAEVDGYPNWIRECSRCSGMDVITPLWGQDRLKLLRRLLYYKFKVIFSCIKKPYLTDEWLGKELDSDSLEGLCTVSTKTGLDICGEQGEYHTLVVDGPSFKKSIHISDYSKCGKDSLRYIDIRRVSLSAK